MPSPYPLRTDRLLLRIMRTADASAFAAYRNDPEVARYQSWDVPYTEQDALGLLADQDDREDLVRGEWTQLAVEEDGELIGDVATHIDEACGVAEIGFTLARARQGQGYASEAALALVFDLVQRIGVARVSAELDPKNAASQRVLENVGLAYERSAGVDSMIYGVTADEWRAWADRGPERS